MTATVPHDLDTEAQVLGAVLAFPGRVDLDELTGALSVDDFYSERHRAVWSAMVELHRQGRTIDAVTVRDAVGDAADGADLIQLQANALALRPEHVEIVQRHALGRRLQRACAATLAEIGDGANPAEVAEQLQAELATVDSPLVGGRLAVDTLDEIVESGEALAPWVIPGLLRSDWRAIVIGGEGRGKSVLLRQIAACTAQGWHPFRARRIEPVPVVVLDAENPAGAIAETGGRLVKQLRRVVGDAYDPERLVVIHDAADLRRRTDRTEVEAVLSRHRPRLIVAGPLYQLFGRRPGERDDDATEPVLKTFDRWRRRYGAALVIEHHAPHGASGSPREMRPYGSSLLNRWPELGIGLRTDGDSLQVGRWRGDRMRNEWPVRLDRGQVWPWDAVWASAPATNDDDGNEPF